MQILQRSFYGPCRRKYHVALYALAMIADGLIFFGTLGIYEGCLSAEALDFLLRLKYDEKV